MNQYIFVSRPPTEAIPHKATDPAFVSYDSVNYTQVRSVELPGGFKMLDFGRATFADKVPNESLYLLSMWPVDDRERADFVLWREYGRDHGGEYEWWLKDVRSTMTDDPDFYNELVDYCAPSIRWAIRLLLEGKNA